ncbi:hypothetical protein GCM10009661_00340 [Catellatospora chokoriensis]|uniref:Uncharacterized protein n=3 Tax=Micromonosporaceae TaxID=28056 RepID=A0A8J3KJ84_9ACTN|nr:hypothetical protein C8E86_7577 [Catellatospora citrea]GIF93391.1 hypothetical protein Cch02nite_68350 [Catellatospora chokoriensis]GIF96129.1 hypothetical protein Cci01nite_12230 [Catellatospora citrea]
MHADNLSPVRPDLSSMTEMTHEAMVARWQQGLVTPMSSTINTFAKTDGSWWTVSDGAWQRVPESARSEQLDYHHDRFASTCQAKGPAGTNSPWGASPGSMTGRR